MKGVSGLRGRRLAQPFIVAINPYITTIMIGEKCADMVKTDARAGAHEGCPPDEPPG